MSRENKSKKRGKAAESLGEQVEFACDKCGSGGGCEAGCRYNGEIGTVYLKVSDVSEFLRLARLLANQISIATGDEAKQTQTDSIKLVRELTNVMKGRDFPNATVITASLALAYSVIESMVKDLQASGDVVEAKPKYTGDPRYN